MGPGPLFLKCEPDPNSYDAQNANSFEPARSNGVSRAVCSIGHRSTGTAVHLPSVFQLDGGGVESGERGQAPGVRGEKAKFRAAGRGAAAEADAVTERAGGSSASTGAGTGSSKKIDGKSGAVE